MNYVLRNLIFAAVPVLCSVTGVGADAVSDTIRTGLNPVAIAIDSVTDKIYVANIHGNTVTVINGATDSATSVNAGNGPQAIAVNRVTDKIYVADFGTRGNYSRVTIINGADNSRDSVVVGINPAALAVNEVTDKIYVANRGVYNNYGSVTVLDGVTNATATLSAGYYPSAIAVNPVTDLIYVADDSANNIPSTDNNDSVKVINGATGLVVATVMVGLKPVAIAVNPVTDKIYVANDSSNTVTIIDGATNATTTVVTGSGPQALAVNEATNTIYVTNYTGNSVTVINGANGSTATVPTGFNPFAIAVNPVTNRVYVANGGIAGIYSTVTVINGATDSTTALNAALEPGAIAVNPATNTIFVANFTSNNVMVIQGAPAAVRSVPAQFKAPGLGYRGIFAVYALNGRQVLRYSFPATASKQSMLRAVNKIPAKGVYRYCFLSDRKLMDEGNLLVR